jgi:hypothetical protein
VLRKRVFHVSELARIQNPTLDVSFRVLFHAENKLLKNKASKSMNNAFALESTVPFVQHLENVTATNVEQNVQMKPNSSIHVMDQSYTPSRASNSCRHRR